MSLDQRRSLYNAGRCCFTTPRILQIDLLMEKFALVPWLDVLFAAPKICRGTPRLSMRSVSSFVANLVDLCTSSKRILLHLKQDLARFYLAV